MVNGLPLDPTFQTLVPFLFVFAITFGVLQLANIFKNNKAVNAVIALALALFAVMNENLVNLLWSVMPSLTIFFIILFLFVFILELFGLRKPLGEGSHVESMITGGVVLFVLLSVGLVVVDVVPIDLPVIGGGENVIFLLAIILIVSVFWATLKAGRGEVAVKKE